MSRSAVPWALVAALLVYAVLARGCSGGAADAAVARAEAAESALDSLAPLVDSLTAEAARRDTVLVTVTDTVAVTIERVRVVAAAADSALRATLDSAQAVVLDELQAAHAEEVRAWQTLADERLVWGTAWKDAAEALEAENVQLRLSGAAWREAYRSSERENRWTKIGSIALAGGSFALGRL